LQRLARRRSGLGREIEDRRRVGDLRLRRDQGRNARGLDAPARRLPAIGDDRQRQGEIGLGHLLRGEVAERGDDIDAQVKPVVLGAGEAGADGGGRRRRPAGVEPERRVAARRIGRGHGLALPAHLRGAGAQESVKSGADHVGRDGRRPGDLGRRRDDGRLRRGRGDRSGLRDRRRRLGRRRGRRRPAFGVMRRRQVGARAGRRGGRG
jgi:hypothetical protein